jgi:multiple sugar transport system substrate-binding protein
MTVSRLMRFAPLLAVAGVLAGCGGSDESTGGKVVLNYGLWESRQVPMYQKCADAFHGQNPNISIHITQTTWNDYWPALAREFIGENAPDVFTDHLAKFPQFAASNVIEPVSTRGVDMNQYQAGLSKLWQTPDGKQYGFPKDWDTVAIVSNAKMLEDAGITKEQLDDATWNPSDGGTFQQLIAKLSVDKNGKRGDEPGFDPTNVKVYGLGLDPGSLTYGQTTWAGFAASLGFKLLDKNPWGKHYNFDDPRFAQVFAWWRRMIEKGYMPSVEQARTLPQTAAFQGGTIALAIDGSWTISTYSTTKGIKVGYSPQPKGPSGSWSLYNGLADGIWVGSKHKPEARKWVRFLGSPECQKFVGQAAVVFPAISSEVPTAVAQHKKDGVDVSAFTSYVKAKHTVLFPITDKAPQINLIVQPTLEKILLGSEDDPAKALKDMNSQVNNVLEFADSQ